VTDKLEKRAKWPSFLLFLGFFFALFTSVLASYFNYWIGISSLLLYLALGPTEKVNFSYLYISAITFSVVLIGNLFLIDIAYTAEDFFYISYFVIGFIVFSQLNVTQITSVFKLLVCIFIFLAIWSYIQYYTGDYYILNSGYRANTIFATPNSYAAAINLILLPLIAINLVNKGKTCLYVAMLILFYSLLTTQSRGGFLSFTVGITIMLIVFYLTNKKTQNNFSKVFLGLFSMILIFIISHVSGLQNNKREIDLEIFERNRLDNVSVDANTRLVLYDVAWQRIKNKPVLGHGYNNFQFYWLKDQRPPFKNSHTNFVHNDYLQLWFETGLIGVFSILLMLSIFYYKTWKLYKVVEQKKLTILLALLGGLSAYSAHAVVDFVMYPCFLALMFAAYLGVATQVLATPDSNNNVISIIKSCAKKLEWNWHFWRIFISILFIILFSQPYIAELSFNYAKNNMKQGDIKIALKYFELARRFAPYNADYYALEGEYLYHTLAYSDQGHEEIANRADELFFKGQQSNPFDIRNLLSRAKLHRDYAKLLSESVNNDMILKWFEKVLFWRPSLVVAQKEYVKTLYQYGLKAEAKEKLESYISMDMNSVELNALKKELIF
jgi:O-antigen ligase